MKTDGDEGLHLYSIHSTKGGVGKTSLAMTIACIESIFLHRKVVILDCDLTGTSLHDIYSREDPPKKWLNDVLLGDPCDHLALIGTKKSVFLEITTPFVDETTNVYAHYIPSDGSYERVKEIVPLIMQEDHLGFFTSRIEDLICLLHNNEDVNTIIIDTHPGFYGFSKAVFSMLLKIAYYQEENNTKKKKLPGTENPRLIEHINNPTKLKALPFFVMTSDKADYLSAVPSIAEITHETLGENKEEDMKNLVYGKILTKSPVFNKATPVNDLPDPQELAEVIVNTLNKHAYKIKDDGRRTRISNIIGVIQAKLKAHAKVGWFVDGFSIDKIPQACQRVCTMKNKIELKDKMDLWVHAITQAMGLVEELDDRGIWNP